MDERPHSLIAFFFNFAHSYIIIIKKELKKNAIREWGRSSIDPDPLQVSGNIFHFRLELSDMPNNSCHSLILVANCGVFGAK